MLARIALGWVLVAFVASPRVAVGSEESLVMTPSQIDDDGCSTLALLEDACLPLVYLRGERVFEPLREAEAGAPPPKKAAGPGSGLSYHLNDSMSAGLSYRHSLLFGLSSSEYLRREPLNELRTDSVQDSVKLDLSWTLPRTIFDFGYRFDAARDRNTPLSLTRPWPEDGRLTHSLMLGVTRQWGGDR
jgi:hypothetical protein